MKNATIKRPRRPVDETLRASRTQQILDAAARLFAKHGYADADTQLLADELGVGKGTLYRYFPSKKALFLAAADRVMRQMRERIDVQIKDIADPLDRIAVATRTFLAFFADNPDFVELLMQERAQFKDRKEPTYFQHRKVNVERWKTLYRQLMAEGRIRAMPVEASLLVMVQWAIRQIAGLTGINELVISAAAYLRGAHRLDVDCAHRPECGVARINVEGPRRARSTLEGDCP